MFSKLNNLNTFYNSEKKIWHGQTIEQKFGSDVSLGSSIQKSLRNQPGHISQICDNNGKHYTNEQILTLSIRIAQNLEEIGIQQEDIVGICASNTDFVAPLVFGTLFIGATFCTLDPALNKDGTRHILNKIIPKIIFCDGGIYQVIKESLAEINTSILIFTMKDHLEGVRRIEELICPTGKEELFNLKPLKGGSRQTAAILCSSGTTNGLPKGICMSHETLVNGYFKLTADKTIFCYSSLNWVSGINSVLHGTISGSTRVITDQSFQAEHFLRIIEQYKVNIVISIPSQMVMAVNCTDFTKRTLSSLETYLLGGDNVPFATAQKFSQHVKRCEMITGYGLAEVCGACCFGISSKAGEVGELKPNFTIKIVDDNDKQVGIGEQGEICIKPPFPWAGYFNDSQATNQTYDRDGFIHSGDLGFFDESASLFIVGRKTNILKYKSFYFFPTEIEEVIMEIPSVLEVCVCVIPDSFSSYIISAAVIKVSGSKLTEEDIVKHVAGKMPHFKHLRVYFVQSLPKTATAKIIRSKVTEIITTLCKTRKEE